MVDVHIVKCRRCKKNITIDDLVIKPDGGRGNVCNHCADILRSLQVVDVREIIKQRMDNKPKYIRCEMCKKLKIWPLEFGPKYVCKLCEKRGTNITPTILKRRRQEKKWREENKDRAKEANERHKEKKKRWKEENPGEARKRNAENRKKYRAKLKVIRAIRRGKLTDGAESPGELIRLEPGKMIREQMNIAPIIWEGKGTGKEIEETVLEMGIGNIPEGRESRTNVL